MNHGFHFLSCCDLLFLLARASCFFLSISCGEYLVWLLDMPWLESWPWLPVSSWGFPASQINADFWFTFTFFEHIPVEPVSGFSMFAGLAHTLEVTVVLEGRLLTQVLCWDAITGIKSSYIYKCSYFPTVNNNILLKRTSLIHIHYQAYVT